jgi:hypothetical protein
VAVPPRFQRERSRLRGLSWYRNQRSADRTKSPTRTATWAAAARPVEDRRTSCGCRTPDLNHCVSRFKAAIAPR